MRIQLSCIVEGHGDEKAVLILIQRIVRTLDPALILSIPPPIRVSRDKLVKLGELERSVELAARKIGGDGAIVILVDADEDCPARLGPTLLTRAQSQRSDLPIAVILAKREYEAWFLAAAESLRGQQGLRQDLQPPPNPEMVSDAKGWLRKQMEASRTYSETVDQPVLTQKFSVETARNADSFDKCWRDIERIVTEIKGK